MIGNLQRKIEDAEKDAEKNAEKTEGEEHMNERIKELAHEVFSFKYKTSPYELNPSHRMDHLHKFAELIVRECANYAFSDEQDHQAMLKHFGVEV